MKEDKKFYVFPGESACMYVYFGERGLHATNACKDSSFFGDRRNEACMVNMEDLLAARTRLQVHEFYSVGIKGDDAGYYFDMPRPPEEIERNCRRFVSWRTLSLCALGWGPPQTDQQIVHVNIEINLSNYKTSNLIDNFRVLVLEGTFFLSIYLVREMDGRM